MTMASIEAISKFITTLRVHFNVPIALTDPERPAKERAWTMSISQCIRPYSDDVLDRASQSILNNWTSSDRRFPLPGKIREVCDDIVVEDKRLPLMQQVLDAQIGENAPPFSRARTKLVLDLLCGEMGRRAAREMWIGSLVDHVRYAKALPDESTVRTLKARSREMEELRGQCHAGVGWPSDITGRALAGMCARMADTIERRNQLWARVVLGQEDEEALFRALPSEGREAA